MFKKAFKYLNKKTDEFIIECSKLEFLKNKSMEVVELFCLVTIMIATLILDFATLSNIFFDIFTMIVMLFVVYRCMSSKI